MVKKIKIGILRETKTPPDRRVAVSPELGKKMLKAFPEVELFIQPSSFRCFTDNEYVSAGLSLKEDLSDCDILVGIKEVKKEYFIQNKTYLFFAHVAKMQPYNADMFKQMIRKNVTLIDYEYLTDENGLRVVAFGKWAGIVGAYNGLRAYGFKFREHELHPASEYKSKVEMFQTLNNIKIKPIKIVITGGGRVASGAMETLNAANIKRISPDDYLSKTFNYPVYTLLEPEHYVKHKDEKQFELRHFFNNPQEYVSTFLQYTKVSDIYMPCHFWDPKSPVFFKLDDITPEFKISVIADISCDIGKPVPTTIRASSIAEPFYDFNPKTKTEELAFSNTQNITVMAVDNLPGELPRDASEDFGKTLFETFFQQYIKNKHSAMIERATILQNGQISDRYKYLNDYAMK